MIVHIRSAERSGLKKKIQIHGKNIVVQFHDFELAFHRALLGAQQKKGIVSSPIRKVFE